MPLANRYLENLDPGHPEPSGYYDEETIAAVPIQTPTLMPAAATRSSAQIITRPYTLEQGKVVHRRKVPKELPLFPFAEFPDPIRQSDFQGHGAATETGYNNLAAFTYFADYPEQGLIEDRFQYKTDTTRGRDIKPSDKAVTRRSPRGWFFHWTGLRRNISREYPETFGTTVSGEMPQNELVYNDLLDRGGY